MARKRKTVETPRSEAKLYLGKAEQFAAEAAAALEESRNDATLLNAVHAAISAADAICVARSGQRSADPDHQRAVELLEDVVGSGDEMKAHVRQVKSLLRKKNEVEYGSRRTTAREARDAEARARRVLAWAKGFV